MRLAFSLIAMIFWIAGTAGAFSPNFGIRLLKQVKSSLVVSARQIEQPVKNTKRL